MSHRVVITGRGCVSALALTRDEHLTRLFEGACGAAETPSSAMYRRDCPLDARVKGFNRRRQLQTRMLRKLLTPSAAFGVVAAGEALREAGLEGNEAILRRAGLFAGSVCIDFDPEIFIPAMKESMAADGSLDITRFATRGIHLIDPLFLVKTLPNGGIGGIAIEHQVTGPSLNITNGTVSGLQAVLSAVHAIRRGETDVMVAGGCDSLVSMDSVAEHLVAERLATEEPIPDRACRPFDQSSNGYVPGEGAAFFVLESHAHAQARGARILGEMLGSGQATTRQAGDAEGLIHCVSQALGEAEVETIDAVFGDGTAVPSDDQMENAAATQVFSNHSVPYTSATSATGFVGAASGPLTLLHALEAMARNTLPPLVGCFQPDPSCTLDLVRTPRKVALERVLVWNSDRGLKTAATVVGAPPA